MQKLVVSHILNVLFDARAHNLVIAARTLGFGEKNFPMLKICSGYKAKRGSKGDKRSPESKFFFSGIIQFSRIVRLRRQNVAPTPLDTFNFSGIVLSKASGLHRCRRRLTSRRDFYCQFPSNRAFTKLVPIACTAALKRTAHSKGEARHEQRWHVPAQKFSTSGLRDLSFMPD